MLRLASLLYTIVGTATVGTGVAAALVAGYDDVQGIVTGAAIGALVALPVSIALARKLDA